MTKRKKKDPFWKKLDPELKSLATHIGKIFDNAKPSDLIDLVAALTAGFAGFRAGQLAGVNLVGSLGLGGSGVMAYQLAKSPNVVAGASGVAYLASLGLINVWNPLTQSVSVVLAPVSKLEDALRAARGLPPLPPDTRIDVAIGGSKFGFGFP